jgi:hypothetical protein
LQKEALLTLDPSRKAKEKSDEVSSG